MSRVDVIKETNGPLASGTDVISLFNPSDSGKTIYLDHMQCSLGSSFAKEPGFDIWVSNTPGANCARVIERKPAKLAGGPVSVAIVNAQCNPRPALDPQWYDGPLYQFAVGDFGPLKGGLKAISMPLIIATLPDAVTQFYLLESVSLIGALLVGGLLVGMPYAAARGLTNRIARHRYETQQENKRSVTRQNHRAPQRSGRTIEKKEL